jgi:SMP-30/Gluconolactonase/LRE-like region
MSVAEVALWSTTAALLSEGPRWHEQAGELLWVDILGATLHRSAIATDGSLLELVTSIAIDRHIGAVAPVSAII